MRHRSRSTAPADEYERTRRPFSYGGLVRLLVVLIILAGVVAMVSWQWSAITEFYQFFSQTGCDAANPGQPKNAVSAIRNSRAASRRSKVLDRRQGRRCRARKRRRPSRSRLCSTRRTGTTSRADATWAPPSGVRKQFRRGAGLAPELAVLADAEIPERRMTVAWSLRRNTDKALPASHTIEIKFNLPADFPGGGIANVPGILMAQADQVRGSPLAGLAVKVTDGFFVIGLSAVDPDMQRNEQLLKGSLVVLHPDRLH